MDRTLTAPLAAAALAVGGLALPATAQASTGSQPVQAGTATPIEAQMASEMVADTSSGPPEGCLP